MLYESFFPNTFGRVENFNLAWVAEVLSSSRYDGYIVIVLNTNTNTTLELTKQSHPGIDVIIYTRESLP